jgi:predicted metal-dependent hydrolase
VEKLCLLLPLPDGKTLKIMMKKSNRAKQLWLRANADGIHVVVPTTINYETKDILTFIANKKKWILRTREYYERLKKGCVDNGNEKNSLEPNNDKNSCDKTICFLGTRYFLQLIKDTTSCATVSNNLKKITFHIIDIRKYKDDIKKWYRMQTAAIIAERLPLIQTTRPNTLLPHYNKISIKEQRRRWGSCSNKRNLNFNLFLAALPIEIIDYVILHEFIHLVEFNHSVKFWNLVRFADPEYKKHRKWLHKYGCLVATIP